MTSLLEGSTKAGPGLTVGQSLFSAGIRSQQAIGPCLLLINHSMT